MRETSDRTRREKTLDGRLDHPDDREMLTTSPSLEYHLDNQLV